MSDAAIIDDDVATQTSSSPPPQAISADQAVALPSIVDEEQSKLIADCEVQEVVREPFYFSLFGDGLNPLIDSSSQLIALLSRIHSLREFDKVDLLYQQVKNEILSLDNQWSKNGSIDRNISSASRFCLCAALDDVILGKSWSKGSQWQSKPLLSLYHRQGSRPDEFYQILARLCSNSEKYKEVIELFYLCLLLGYKGHYNEKNGKKEKRKEVLYQLKMLLTKYHANPSVRISEPQKYQVKEAYKIEADYPRWPVYCLTAVALLSIYVFFNTLMDSETANLLQQLKSLGDLK